MTTIDAAVVTAVIGHMNGDHTEDNLLIVRAFAEPDATAARMTGLDGRSGEWVAEVDGVDRTVRVPWLGPVTDRASIRTEVVALYRAACEKLGVAPDEH
ncbi:DUF2470 domain-containing protein [Rhodococcus hoagii]|uniref:DUF2470 domain-containing protein n=1 Tax=Prescottella TaxID=2979332 RepID=UPI000A0FA177|nr:DUF2470 domain-containing protein [Prescottella equi]NKR25085.1 DUF2470 domain-containing protein [Prescottella equi]NKR50368.1 DUF2470 domain-containing protein [Prescottella equi]NKR63081.1 DUF2470 domain-containing protein [Prescottella equi]NKR79685.1 DUF2470 domain-containing protein [Prescottella equi]NKS01128.1 DUF2470 domain-containing protein [Prescottella equi]